MKCNIKLKRITVESIHTQLQTSAQTITHPSLLKKSGLRKKHIAQHCFSNKAQGLMQAKNKNSSCSPMMQNAQIHSLSLSLSRMHTHPLTHTHTHTDILSNIYISFEDVVWYVLVQMPKHEMTFLSIYF